MCILHVDRKWSVDQLKFFNFSQTINECYTMFRIKHGTIGSGGEKPNDILSNYDSRLRNTTKTEKLLNKHLMVFIVRVCANVEIIIVSQLTRRTRLLTIKLFLKTRRESKRFSFLSRDTESIGIPCLSPFRCIVLSSCTVRSKRLFYYVYRNGII